MNSNETGQISGGFFESILYVGDIWFVCFFSMNDVYEESCCVIGYFSFFFYIKNAPKAEAQIKY